MGIASKEKLNNNNNNIARKTKKSTKLFTSDKMPLFELT